VTFSFFFFVLVGPPNLQDANQDALHEACTSSKPSTAAVVSALLATGRLDVNRTDVGCLVLSVSGFGAKLGCSRSYFTCNGFINLPLNKLDLLAVLLGLRLH
jgi:hypothetical protein